MPKNNKRERSMSQKALKRAERELCDQINNRVITNKANYLMEQKMINNLIEDAHRKSKLFIHIAIKVQEQGREAVDECTCAYALSMIWNAMFQLREQGHKELDKYVKVSHMIDVIVCCIKNKFQYKDNVALIILNEVLGNVKIKDAEWDEYYKEGRDVLCLKLGNGDCNGFIIVREPKTEYSQHPLLVEYAMIDKADRRTGIMSKCLINIEKHQTKTGIVLHVEHDNIPMNNLMKKLGAVNIMNNEVARVNKYYYKS